MLIFSSGQSQVDRPASGASLGTPRPESGLVLPSLSSAIQGPARPDGR